MTSKLSRLLLGGMLSILFVERAAAQTAAPTPLAALTAATPASAAECTPERLAALEQAAPAFEAWYAEQGLFRGVAGHEAGLARIAALLDAKDAVDRLLTQTLAFRGEFAALPEGDERRERMRRYLRSCAVLIDLSGRLRYMQVDALSGAAARVMNEPIYFEALVDLLLQKRSSIGAVVAARGLSELPPTPQRERVLFQRRDAGQAKRKVLELIAQTGEREALPAVVQFLSAADTPADLKLAAAETIRRVGLPQPPHPAQDPTIPPPPITPQQLQAQLEAIDARRLAPSDRGRRDELLAWAARRSKTGLAEGEAYQLGAFAVEPGDWLLMRNPSPYNLFTDLSPGLFTHVGIMTSDIGKDGVRRLVLIDLPERGDAIQTTNIDAFVLRTLHYVVLRHPDPQVRAKMGETAAAVIGAPSQFDLNFRTARVEALRGQPLAGKKIHTYCAGLLLLCAQETSAPRHDFFPIREFPAGGKTVENLAGIGLTFGDNFISPTGALFSPKLEIAGRRQSMYEPRREAEEAVYDHFATSLIDRTLTPSPDLFQSIRQSLADASQTNPLLAQALATAVGVNADTDLASAARAAAVVEALDEVAERAGDGFLNARMALLAGPLETLSQQGYGPDDLAAIRAYRERHADLSQRLAARQIMPRQLRIELMNYYIDKGKRELDARFFHEAAAEK